MEINIKLDREDIEKILNANGYVSELVVLWYNCDIEDKIECLCPIKKPIAYRNGERPITLEGENPRLENNKEHMVENVVQKLFKKRLMELMY